mmetsp:Transcript_82/g.182  ORF Transcript_82/g.182 Transcript_82/m.182 type:complete len:261 (+) Transcript_82:29-811(+)
MGRFGAAEGAAAQMLELVCDFQVGAAVAPIGPAEKNARVVEQCRFEVWIEDLQVHYRTLQAAKAAAREAAPEVPTTVDEEALLLDRIDRLKLEVRECTLEHAREAHLVDRMRHTAVLSAAVFPHDDESPAAGLDGVTAAALTARAKWRDSAASEILDVHRRVLEAKAEVEGLRRDNTQLMHRNRAAMRELKELREASAAPRTQLSEETAAEAEEGLILQTHRNTILRNLFQAIIVGSSIDWASDPALRETMLQLGTPPDI